MIYWALTFLFRDSPKGCLKVIVIPVGAERNTGIPFVNQEIPVFFQKNTEKNRNDNTFQDFKNTL
jgi:hypothetical protein